MRLRENRQWLVVDRDIHLSTVFMHLSVLSGKFPEFVIIVVMHRGCEQYSDYLIGLNFHIETDHKPSVPLFSP